MTARPSTPGRPAEFSRQEAIERAMNLFWREGYLGVTTRDLADAMNIQRSSFYNSFGDRESVFLEALELYAKGAPDNVLDKLQPGEPVLPVLVGFFRELCRQRAEDREARGCLVCNSIAELVGVEKRLGNVLLDAVKAQLAVNARVLQQAVDQGELTLKTDVGSAAQSLTAFILGFNLLTKAIRDEEQLRGSCRSYLIGLGVSHAMLRD